MAMLAAGLIGLDEPEAARTDQEADRLCGRWTACTADAVAHVSGQAGPPQPQVHGLRHHGRHLFEPGYRQVLSGGLHRGGPRPGGGLRAEVSGKFPAAAHGLLPHADSVAVQSPAGAGPDQIGGTCPARPSARSPASAVGRSCANGREAVQDGKYIWPRVPRTPIFQTPARSPGRI